MKRIVLLVSVLALTACQAGNPVLTVEGGKIKGIPSVADGVTLFCAVPYAAAPVGELRWAAPQPVAPWDGVRDCDIFSKIAWQNGNPPGTFYGDEFYWEGTPDCDEDCLYLNVWAPTKTLGKNAKLPVAMWIHGGAYMNGYGFEVTMDGDEWARRGVILVTINYRLGGFGFLSHPELSAEQGGSSGNYGLMDQIAALQWVKNNIAAFGGDPDNITIFGQSAGAMSVKNLMISPMSRDLISKAIIQSGGGIGLRSLSPVNSVPQEVYDAQGKAFTDWAGLNTLEEMRAVPADELFRLSNQMTAAVGRRVSLSPHIDGKVLTEDFDHALYDGNMARVPVMIGYNKDDMGMLAGPSADRFCAVRDSLGFPVYEYEFMRELPNDDDHPNSDAGAFHSAELWYMFGTLSRSWRPFTDADYELSARMLDAWTSFCKSGNPGWAAYKHDNPCKQLFDIK